MKILLLIAALLIANSASAQYPFVNEPKSMSLDLLSEYPVLIDSTANSYSYTDVEFEYTWDGDLRRRSGDVVFTVDSNDLVNFYQVTFKKMKPREFAKFFQTGKKDPGVRIKEDRTSIRIWIPFMINMTVTYYKKENLAIVQGSRIGELKSFIDF